MKIPKSVKLMGHTITVEVVNKKDWDVEGAVAIWIPDEYRIRLMRQPRARLAHAYLHELTHATLDAMGHKLSRNESFVDLFSGLLSQALETAE